MFQIAFGATLRLHTTIVHLLIKDLNLEEWKRQLLDCAVRTEGFHTRARGLRDDRLSREQRRRVVADWQESLRCFEFSGCVSKARSPASGLRTRVHTLCRHCSETAVSPLFVSACRVWRVKMGQKNPNKLSHFKVVFLSFISIHLTLMTAWLKKQAFTLLNKISQLTGSNNKRQHTTHLPSSLTLQARHTKNSQIHHTQNVKMQMRNFTSTSKF